MKYEPVPKMSMAQIEAALSGSDIDDICDAILSASLYIEDWRVAQGICVKGLSLKFKDAKRCALIGLGHVVRIHGNIDLSVVENEISKLKKDNSLSGYVENLQSDINIFFDGSRGSG